MPVFVDRLSVTQSGSLARAVRHLFGQRLLVYEWSCRSHPDGQAPTSILEGGRVPDNKHLNNTSPFYADLKRQHQALEILSVLEADNRTAPARLLADWLAACGLGAADQDLDELLNVLASEGLVRLAENDRALIVHLTGAGVETALGVNRSKWVARPLPR